MESETKWPNLLVICVVLVSCCSTCVWCSILCAQDAENGCRECATGFRFQSVLEWSSSRRCYFLFLFVCPDHFLVRECNYSESAECEGLLYMHVHEIRLCVVVSVCCSAS